MARIKKNILPIGHARDIADGWTRQRPDLDPLDYLLPIYMVRLGRIVETRRRPDVEKAVQDKQSGDAGFACSPSCG
jgi:hypothetical protein